ncbi:MAG: DUF2029 domain-containing protein [Planctomycetota bacterium]|nr:DUF2029 domain-containing protein [Planctomycetota bacterium]
MTAVPERLRVWSLRVALGAGLVLLAFALLESWNDVRTYGGVDLRDKVVFARLLWAGQDPYFAEMRADWPETLIDPYYNTDPIRISVPPTAILPYVPLCNLPYGTQRLIYFALDWAALLGASLLLAHLLRPNRGRGLFLLLALYFFATSYFWRLHVERGQYYGPLLFVLALAAWLLLKADRPRAAGVLLGLSAAVRPTLVVVPLLCWLLKRRAAAGFAAGALALALLASLPLGGVQAWTNYAKAVKLWELQFVDPAAVPKREVSPLPMIVEGTDFRDYLPGKTTNTAVMSQLADLKEFGLPASCIRYAGWLCKALAAGLAAFVFLRAVRGRQGPRAHRGVLALAVLLAFNLDYLLAPMRAGYVDVLLLLPIALLLPWFCSAKVHRGYLLVLLAGLLIGRILNDELGTYYRSYLVMLSLDALALMVLLRCRRVFSPSKP